MNTLVTGGLGYIGSHIAMKLNHKAIIIDNCSNSKLDYKRYLPFCKVYKKNLDFQSLDKIFASHKITNVIHLAGSKSVNDSISNPLEYYENNVSSTINLLKVMQKYNTKRLVFSSSATVYGIYNKSPLKENMKLKAINPYGRTKIFIEKIIDDFVLSSKNFKAISLRYFNPIGSTRKNILPEQPLGNPQNIMPVLINSIINDQEFNIYGKNYATKDGTCIRDYLHVDDLAEAHIKSLKSFKKISGHEKINIGTGKGYSVLDLINTFEKINKVKIKFKFTKRRAGDAAISYASNQKAKRFLNWYPKFGLKDMCMDSWQSTQ